MADQVVLDRAESQRRLDRGNFHPLAHGDTAFSVMPAWLGVIWALAGSR